MSLLIDVNYIVVLKIVLDKFVIHLVSKQGFLNNDLIIINM